MAMFKKSSKPNDPKKKGGILGALGIQTEAVPTESDHRDKDREKNIRLAWKYLRSRIDLSIHEYYRSGKFTKLEEFVERPALDALRQELHTLRSENIFWQQPDRQTLTEPEIVVGPVELNKKGQPTKFTIRERFKDYSVHQRVVDQQLVPDARSDGSERVIEATVTVRNGSEYKLHSVRQVRNATLGG